MGIFEGHLLASDIDGTLLDNGFLPQRNLDAINFFLKEGGAFSLSTGRTITAIGDVLKKLGDISPCIMANGSIIYDHTAHKVLHHETLSREDCEFAKKLFDFNPNVGIQVHSLERVLILRRTQGVEDHDTYEGIINEDISFEDALKLPWNEVLYIFDTEQEREDAAEFVKKLGLSDRIVNTSATIYGTKRFFLQQNPLGVTKATALKNLCKLLNIKEGCCYAVGDYFNDLPMLKAADVAAVVEGSPKELLSIADVVVKSANYGAVADFINYLKNSVKTD